MNRVRKHVPLVLGAVCFLGVTTLAHAVALNVPTGATYSATTSLPGTTDAAEPYLSGTVLQDVLTPFAVDGITGTVQNRVVQETGTGTLDFYWKVNVDSSSATLDGLPAQIDEFRIGDFGIGNITDGDYRIDGLGTVAPGYVTVFNNADVPGGFVNFEFGNSPIDPGQSSNFFFLHTQATQYTQSAVYDLTASLSGAPHSIEYATFAPVPEPQAWALVIAGLALSAALARTPRREGSSS